MTESTPELPVLIGPGQDEPETLLLVSERDAAGHVTMRRWTAANWGAPPTMHDMHAAALYQWFENVRRHNRTLNQSLPLLRTWLRP